MSEAKGAPCIANEYGHRLYGLKFRFHNMPDPFGEVTTLRQQLEEAEARYEACKLQAQIWKQEARAQSATIAEIYQEVTGKTGEPGDWNGARPIKAAIFRKQAEAVEKAANENRLVGDRLGDIVLYEDLIIDVAEMRQQADDMEKNDE